MTVSKAYMGTGTLIDNIEKGLARAEEAERARIPESLFVNQFLKFFAGQEVDPNPTPENSKPALWIGLAGNPFAPVDVFDDRTQEILYTVPPFFDMEAVGVSKRKHGSIHAMLKEVSDLSAIHPTQGQAHFQKYINSLEILHDRRDEAVAQAKTWLAIFQRYGIIPVDFSLAPEETKPATETNSAANGLVYGDDDML